MQTSGPQKLSTFATLRAKTACGAWQQRREVFVREQVQAFPGVFPMVIENDPSFAQAADILGVARDCTRDAVMSRLRRLALRYPPEQHRDRWSAFKSAADLFEHPLLALSASLTRDIEPQAHFISQQIVPPDPEAPLDEIMRWITGK